MRGRFQDNCGLFSYISPERRVPANHPLRQIRPLVRDVLNADSCASRTLIPIHRGQRSCDCGQFLKIV